MWETQARKFTTSKKMIVDICLPEFSSMKIVTWKCHLENSTNGGYDMILDRDLLTALLIDINAFDNTILGGEGTYEGCFAPMVAVKITTLI